MVRQLRPRDAMRLVAADVGRAVRSVYARLVLLRLRLV
jgi:hypothetical protein